MVHLVYLIHLGNAAQLRLQTNTAVVTSAKEDMESSLFVCLFVCLLAALCKNFQTDLHEIFRESWQWANEQMIKVWWRSGSRVRIRIRIATLVRRALPIRYALSQCFQFRNYSRDGRFSSTTRMRLWLTY